MYFHNVATLCTNNTRMMSMFYLELNMSRFVSNLFILFGPIPVKRNVVIVWSVA